MAGILFKVGSEADQLVAVDRTLDRMDVHKIRRSKRSNIILNS